MAIVYDVGMHEAEDTRFYLKRGHKVIAIDANKSSLDRAAERFSSPVRRGSLILLNCAIYDEDDREIDFYVSRTSEWSSPNRMIADRRGQLSHAVKVRTRTLASVIKEFGLPGYCKIDIEGCDQICLRTLSGSEALPAYLSVETECLAEGEKITDAEALATLDSLVRLGYREFKLVDQDSLCVLRPGIRFMDIGRPRRLLKRLNRLKLAGTFGHVFPRGASGPFGDDLAGTWMGYAEARETLLYHRRAHFTISRDAFTFWCDWHARRGA